MPEFNSLRNCIQQFKNADQTWDTYGYLVSDFLDRFYAIPNLFYVLEEPDFDATVAEPVPAYTAATCEALCNKYRFILPEWCMSDKYINSEPWFGFKSKGMMQYIQFIESPVEFRKRNLFVTENALSRC